jgi:hypothetical protein
MFAKDAFEKDGLDPYISHAERAAVPGKWRAINGHFFSHTRNQNLARRLLTMAPSSKEIINLADNSGDDDNAESSKPNTSSTVKQTKKNGRGVVLPRDGCDDDDSSVEFVGGAAASPAALPRPAAKKARIHQLLSTVSKIAVHQNKENNNE